MRLSELIAELQALQSPHGDNDVRVEFPGEDAEAGHPYYANGVVFVPAWNVRQQKHGEKAR